MVAIHLRILTDVEFGNRHLTLGKGSSFAHAHVMEHCASLHALKVLDQDVVLFERVNRKSHRDGHCQWETLWNSDDHDDHSSDSNLSELQKGSIGEEFLLSANDLTDEEHELSDDTKEGGNHSILGDLFGSLLKLVLKESELLLDDQVLGLSVSGQESVFTNATDYSFTLSSHDL